MTDTSSRLGRLRAEMKARDLAAYIVPSEDAHQSEYIASCDERRAFISGFTGSLGLAIVSMDKAALFTDGRYFLQAEKQLDSNWSLVKMGIPGHPTEDEWLVHNVSRGSSIGVDPQLFTNKRFQDMASKCSSTGGLTLKAISPNLIDLIWTDRPAFPSAPIIAHPETFSGKSASTKISELRENMAKGGCSHVVLSVLDEIAWLFNLRGGDIAYNPVFRAYALISASEIVLFVNAEQLTPDASAILDGLHCVVHPYHCVWDALAQLKEVKSVWVGPRCSQALALCFPPHLLCEDMLSITHDKSIKNNVELAGMKACHVRDSVALCEYFRWLEDRAADNTLSSYTEVTASDRLEAFRKEQRDFMGLSFATISGYGPNGAIIHYHAESETCRHIGSDALLLVDSGGQYRDGTTDVTRTVHLGTPSSYEKECYTRVLKGHIALACAVFPTGTSGLQLDILARLPLFEVGLNYLHGTGHGVGSFLNVHEGPASISFRVGSHTHPLRAGMILSNEPGYYEAGSFGIRIENLVEVISAKTKHKFGGVDYLTFGHVTLVPYQAKLIEGSLLTLQERSWIDAYHATVLEVVGAEMLSQGRHDAYAWLRANTTPLP